MYEDFWGCYKPLNENDKLTYDFEPGIFANVLIKALREPLKNFVLVIEEINRANVYDVFGLLFQLLDRKNGQNPVSISVPTEAKEKLKKMCDKPLAKLSLPDNLFIIATMNPADQGVHTLDTAFLRRFSMAYIDIDGRLWASGLAPIDFENLEAMPSFTGGSRTVGEISGTVERIRKKINTVLIGEGHTDDKLISAHFVRDSATEMEFLLNIASYLLTIYKVPTGRADARKQIFPEALVNQWRLTEILNAYEKAGASLEALFGL